MQYALPSTRQSTLFLFCFLSMLLYSQDKKRPFPMFITTQYGYLQFTQVQTLTKRRGSIDSRWASNKNAPTIGIAPAKTIAQWYDPPDAETIADAIGVPSMLPITLYTVALKIHKGVVKHMFSMSTLLHLLLDNLRQHPFPGKKKTYQRGCQSTTSQPQQPTFQPPQPQLQPRGRDSQTHLH